MHVSICLSVYLSVRRCTAPAVTPCVLPQLSDAALAEYAHDFAAALAALPCAP
jgi:hypothetical protein